MAWFICPCALELVVDLQPPSNITTLIKGLISTAITVGWVSRRSYCITSRWACLRQADQPYFILRMQINKLCPCLALFSFWVDSSLSFCPTRRWVFARPCCRTIASLDRSYSHWQLARRSLASCWRRMELSGTFSALIYYSLPKLEVAAFPNASFHRSPSPRVCPIPSCISRLEVDLIIK